MATVTAQLDKRYKAKDGYAIKIRILIGNEEKYLSTGYRVTDKQFKDGKVTRHEDSGLINEVIDARIRQTKEYLKECIIKNKTPNLNLLKSGQLSGSFCKYLIHRAKQYEEKGKVVMWQKLNRFAKELEQFAGKDVLFAEIDQDFLRNFEAWLINERKNVPNTRHKKFKFMRQFFDHAIVEDKYDGKNPFRTYKIITTEVKKDKLSVAEIAALEAVKLKPGPVNDARNMFLFSYYAHGMRFENVATLQWSNIRKGRIVTISNKSGKPLSIKIHARLQAILDQYRKGESDIIFPILKEISEDPKQYRMQKDVANFTVNRNLKILMPIAGIDSHLTFHIARHTFAQHLKISSKSVSVVQDALKHSTERTTQRYLKALEDDALDLEMDKLYGG